MKKIYLLQSFLLTCVSVAQLFYIYDDIAENLKDTWPPMNMPKTVNQSIFHQTFHENQGCGSLINASSGLFNTWQFSVFKLIYRRLQHSPLRTMDPNKASLFFLPYDGGVDALISSYDGRLLKSKCPRSGRAKHHLQSSVYLQRKGGRDHFIIFSVIQGVSSLNSPGCRVLYTETCALCKKLTIEVSYHKDSVTAAAALPSSEKKKSRGSVFKYDPTWISIPYPSSFHYWENSVDIPWKRQPRSREITAIFIGGGKILNAASKTLRNRLRSQCARHANCIWIDTGQQRTGFNVGKMLDYYRKSVFCLSPPGDSPTRKGLFDSILAGCIPVVFDPYTLHDQYHWYIGTARQNISVYIPIQDILGTFTASTKRNKNNKLLLDEETSITKDFMEFLMDIPENEVQKMQETIERIGWSLQYSIPPFFLGGNEVWSPPLPDAVDVMLDKLFLGLTIFSNNSTT